MLTLGHRLILVLIALALASPAEEQGPPAKPQWPGDESLLESTNARARIAAFRNLYAPVNEKRREAATICIGVINAHTERVATTYFSPKLLAIQALEELREPETIPVLIREIDYTSVEFRVSDSPLGGMPAARALCAIGLPAVTAILSNPLLGNAPPERLERFALVIRYAFPDASTARAFVQTYDPRYSPEAETRRAELLKLLSGAETKAASSPSSPTTQAAAPPASQPVATQPGAPPATQSSSAPTGQQP